MAKSEQGEVKAKRKFSGPKKWFLETKSELKKVSWPTKKQTLSSTIEVFAAIVFFGVIVWAADGILLPAVNLLLRQVPD